MDSGEKNSILIVDDDKNNLDTLSIILSSEYKIYTAEEGISAVGIANNRLPDVIILDILMTGMSGYDVLTELKRSAKTRSIPVIILTGLDSDEDEEKGLTLDAADFIQKPLNARIIKLRVRNQIQIVNQIRAIKKYAREVAASEERSKFFARMSHEMRTPLNAVLGLSEMTLDEGGISEDARENLEKISSSGESLLSLVNDLLDISKIESGMFTLVPIEYDLSFMLSDVVNQSIIIKGEKPIDFIVEIDEKLPARLIGDDLRIKQVLNNLLSNAFKYTREGFVKLLVNGKHSKDENIELSVSIIDTGIGIESEYIDRVFSEYVQADLKANKYTEGTGLGLSITKMMVDIMGGKISVKSEYGKGSNFTVIFPQKLIDCMENGDKVIGPEIAANIKNFNYSKRRSSKPRLRRIPAPYANVLVVDDVIYNLDVARGMMKPYKMQIDCVTSGQEAVDAIREEKVKYNAIFMDHMMPEMDGIEAAQIIRDEIATEYAKKIPIIAFTANAIAGNEEMFLSKGFQDFLSKPIENLRLDTVINKWIRDEEQDKLYEDEEIQEYSGEERRSGKDRRKENIQSLIKGEIKGVDLQKGLERFNGDKDTFFDVMRSFALNTRQLLEIIREVDEEKLKDYAIHVHGVKSSCRGICCESLGSRAEALEMAAKAGNLAFVQENNTPFINDVLFLIGEIETAFTDDNVQTEKPKKDKPYKEALISLKTACKNLQIEVVDSIIKEIECFEYTDDDNLVLWLKENADQMNYSEIDERLSKII
jgi:signal transduction histidine kinase